MKVLQIYKTAFPFSIGGIERFIHSLSHRITQQGHECDIATTSSERTVEKVGQSKIFGYQQLFNKFSCPVSLSLIKEYKEITGPYDLLHYHFPWPFADFMHVITNCKKPYIITYHSDIVNQPKFLTSGYQPLMNRFFSRAKKIIVTSENLAKTSITAQRYADKTLVIPITVEPSLYPQENPIITAKLRSQIGGDFFLFIGVLRYYKGLEFLLEAIKDTEINVVIAGAGPEEKKLKSIAEANNIKNAIFLGSVEEVEKISLLKLCKAVIAPAHLRSEAFCISLLEGLTYGKPLISTELGTGTSFVNKHNVSGLVVNPKDIHALRNAIIKLDSDKELVENLSQGAKQHFNNEFSPSKMGNAYLKLYEDILK